MKRRGRGWNNSSCLKLLSFRGFIIRMWCRYENLVLVTGGIGISPFLAIMSDILHRTGEGKPCSPKNVLVVWAVKKATELSLLSAVDAQFVYPKFSDKIHLDIQAYVTQESEAPLEEGELDKSLSTSSLSFINGTSMSNLVGTGNNIWLCMYVTVTSIGFIIFYGLVEAFYIKRFGVTTWWYQGLLFILCMVATVVLLGGMIVSLWNKWEKRCQDYENVMSDNEKNNLGQFKDPVTHSETDISILESLQTTHYGSRPDFQVYSGMQKASWKLYHHGIHVSRNPEDVSTQEDPYSCPQKLF